jgi:hypothetical protein
MSTVIVPIVVDKLFALFGAHISTHGMEWLYTPCLVFEKDGPSIGPDPKHLTELRWGLFFVPFCLYISDVGCSCSSYLFTMVVPELFGWQR